MNSTNSSAYGQSQGRETSCLLRQSLLARQRHRSLNHGLCRLRLGLHGFAPLRLSVSALLLVFMFAAAIHAQEVADTIKISTRVVFLDALVKDKKTSLPIPSLAREDFEVYDEGQRRELSYFTREGQARKPLALILILDLRNDGAGRFMKKDEVLKAMLEVLAKLPPEDEVAIMAMDTNDEDENKVWLTEFTHDRATLAAALALVPDFCVSAMGPAAQAFIETQRKANAEQQQAAAATESTNGDGQNASSRHDIVGTEVIKGKSGATVTRTIHRDGTTDVKRINKKGDVTIQFDGIYDMAAAVRDATQKGEKLRPNSQLSIVWVSDGIAPIFFEDRDATEQVLIRKNVIFNSLTVDLRTLFKFLLPIGKPIAGWMGVSLYGSAKRLAQQSGGEAVKVGKPKDYATGLNRIIGNLTARYSLGFTLAENENDDGRLHSLEVRVNAKDEKGKKRKLAVSSRQGYYMSTTAPKETVVKAQ